MSLSESEKELLLSASLDGAVSSEEQAMLDKWFKEDPSALKQRDELAEVRDQLRVAMAQTRRAKLGAGFADRVVEAAIAQAQRENLAPTHPLVRLAQPAESAAARGGRSRWRAVAACVALAASLLLAVYFGRTLDNHDAQGPQGLAQLEPDPQRLPEAPENSVAGNDALSPIGPSSEDQQIAGETDPLREPDGGSAVRDIASAPTMQADPPLPGAELAPESAPGTVPLVAVMVVSVELTQQGRESLALLEALRTADIQIAPSGVVSEQVVNHLRQSDVITTPEDENGSRLYFIEAPAKQLDRFLLRLMADKDSFASFGLSIADNPPLLASVDDWREVDPTMLRHGDTGAIARDLVSSDGAPLAIDQGPAFIPMPREMGTAGLLAPPTPTSNKDIPSQILLLIR